jgi:LPXTG-motif cell wall-anchored protein
MLESDVLLQYTVSEAYISGYSPTINKLENGTYVVEDWVESAKFTNGEKYLLKTSKGYLSTVSAKSNTLCFVDETTAKNSDLAFWTATVSSGKVKLTNQAGQSLNYYGSGSTRYFNATTGSANSQNLTTSTYSNGIRLSFKSGTRNYYLADLNNNNYAKAETSSGAALTFYPMVKTVTTTTVKLVGYGYTIINTPLKQETSLTVVKLWDYPLGDSSIYEKEQVTIRLLANGVDSGRTETVSIKNEWTAVFNGLPYLDEAGNIIVYTVVENWETEDWIPTYGPISVVGGSEVPTYTTTIINTYSRTNTTELPSTGSSGPLIYILCGLILVLGPFVYGFRLRRKYGRRSKR